MRPRITLDVENGGQRARFDHRPFAAAILCMPSTYPSAFTIDTIRDSTSDFSSLYGRY